MSSRPNAGPSDPAEIAGRYEVVQKLGAGAFGTVYKAKDKILGRMVAIKTIRLEGLAAAGASLDELMDRFKREAQVSAQLKHPHIVTIYDIGDMDGLSYLAMEFIDGVGLDRIIASEGRLDIERAASLGAQVADALDFAHRHNVVHRDIKPANIMVESNDRVKVTDFGIAKVTDSAEHLTATGSLLGTPSYMSPEQARGSAIDGRSDLFSVGCILYEMVTGKKAFRGESITGLIFKIITEEPPPIHDIDPTVPDDIVRVIARALAKAPEVRYQSGRELADDLLTFTRAGSTPTVRQSELDTAAGTQIIPGSPTVKAAPTVQAPPTIQTPPTVQAPPAGPANAAGRPAAPARPPSAAPLVGAGAGPTILTPPPLPAAPPPAEAARRPAPPRSASAAPAARAATPAAAPRKSAAGILVAVGLGGLLLLAALAIGGYFLYQRSKATGDLAQSPGTTATAAPASEPPPATLIGGAPITEAPATTPGEAGTRVADSGTSGQAPPAGTAGGTNAGGRPPVSGGAPGGKEAPAPAGGGTTPAVTTPPAADAEADLAFLMHEPPAMDGREVGGEVADTYRQRDQTSGNFGTKRRLRARERFPTNARPPEMPAVLTLRNIIHFEELFKERQGRYGDFAETLPRQVPSGRSFRFRGYRFDLVAADGDSFKVVATPLNVGLRGFVADDTGFVRFAED